MTPHQTPGPQASHDGLPQAEARAWRAVAEWYHAAFTGIVLYVVSRQGPAAAEAFVYEIFCRQRREKFLPGLRKLGLDRLPPAVAAAQYHYLSNHIGGVAVEYGFESERKAWIRYRAPRWIWAGTALCGIPPEVSRAMLRGWHAQNGLMLGNPRLGFVCTQQTVDGQACLEGYYYEYEHELQPHERLRFAREERAPVFDPAAAPQLPTVDWPAGRLAKAHRNYAMEYVRSAFSTALQLWGPDEAGHRLRMACRMVGMQFFHEVARGLGGPYPEGAEGFARFLADLAAAHGDRVDHRQADGGHEVHQQGWVFAEGLADVRELLPAAWNGLIEGAASAHQPDLRLRSECRPASEGGGFAWAVSDPRC